MAETASSSAPTAPKSFYDFVMKDLATDEEVPLANYKGKVCIVVNVASKCGFTDSNYKGLVEMHKKFHEKGLEVLAFPCNQFGGQEPGTASEICSFAASKFNATFPLFEKVDVNGKDTHPLYVWLKSQDKGKGTLGDRIKWNFTKFIIDKNGEVRARHGPNTEPHKFEKEVEQLLEEPVKA
eukprot:JZ551003.1.p1 GENE.JZ551003.1~~JZ551003.1.p1  ORF type:complete len:189 (+),score=47.23 JZ551003.1:26-568(+)